LSYYYDHVTFVLKNEKSIWPFASEVVRGDLLNNTPLYLQRKDPRVPPGISYSVVRVNGLIEIIEHRRTGAVFDISDDPEIRTELLELLRTTQGIEGLK